MFIHKLFQHPGEPVLVVMVIKVMNLPKPNQSGQNMSNWSPLLGRTTRTTEKSVPKECGVQGTEPLDACWSDDTSAHLANPPIPFESL